MNKAYQRATHKMVDGALTMQQIDKQRELDRFWARQQRIKARQHDQVKRTTATEPSADIGRHIEVEANHA